MIQISNKSEIMGKNGFIWKNQCTKFNGKFSKKILFTFGQDQHPGKLIL